MELVVKLLRREVEIAAAQMEIREHVEKEIQGRQREVVLRQQLKYIQQELGISKDDKTAEADEFKARIEKLQLPEKVAARIDEELNKLQMLEVGSPEYGVTRNYLDWLTCLPWGIYSKDATDLAAATRILNKHHEGLEDIKARIIEFLALGIMKGDAAGSIICFVGPPGVGKTSLGRSIADALGREFYRFSVGGMRDEAEIKGHRRTFASVKSAPSRRVPARTAPPSRAPASRAPVRMAPCISEPRRSAPFSCAKERSTPFRSTLNRTAVSTIITWMWNSTSRKSYSSVPPTS